MSANHEHGHAGHSHGVTEAAIASQRWGMLTQPDAAARASWSDPRAQPYGQLALP
jgi:hypothetical protein